MFRIFCDETRDRFDNMEFFYKIQDAIDAVSVKIAGFISRKAFFFSLVFGNVVGWIYAAFFIRHIYRIGEVVTVQQILYCYFASQYVRLFNYGLTFMSFSQLKEEVSSVHSYTTKEKIGHYESYWNGDRFKHNWVTDSVVKYEGTYSETTNLIVGFITSLSLPIAIVIIYFIIEDIIMRFNKPTEYLDYALIAITAIYNIIFLIDFFKNVKAKIQIYKKNREDNVKSVTRAIGFSIEIIIYFASIILGAYLGLWLLRNHIPVIKTYFPFFN